MSDDKRHETARVLAVTAVLICGAVTAVTGTITIISWMVDELTRTFADIAARWSGW